MCATITLDRFYVYVLLDLRKSGDFNFGDLNFKNQPYYVGKGSGRRCFKHFEESEFKRPYNKHKNNITKKILEAGFSPKDCVFFLAENLLEEESLRLETEIIARIGTTSLKTGPLSNKNDGGESPGSHTRGRTWEECWGKQRAEERRKELTEQKERSRKIKLEMKKLLPPKIPKERDLSWCKKRIVRIDQNLNVERFSSITEARRVSKIRSSGIHHSLSLKEDLGTSGGFVWIYESEFDKMSEMEIKRHVRQAFLKKNFSRKMVVQIEPETQKEIAVFESRAHAAEAVLGSKRRAGDITAAIKNKSLTYGYYWNNVY